MIGKILLSTGIGAAAGGAYAAWAQTATIRCTGCDHSPVVPVVAGAVIGLIAVLCGK